MNWADWIILGLLALTTLAGLAQGFFRTFCSLGGLLIGLTLATWDYDRFGKMLDPILKIEPVANGVGFLVIALIIMLVGNVIGGVLARTFRWMGLGCLDGLGGAIFGFLQGSVMVVIGILVTVAFFPGQKWLQEAKLPKLFLSPLHISERLAPGDLGDHVRDGLRYLEHEAPQLSHPGNGGV